MPAQLRLNKLLLVAGSGLLINLALAREPPTPLLQILEQLECAVDAKSAHSILGKLFNISPLGQEWPDEWLGKKPATPVLYAGTLDIALNTLKSTAERFPELREDSERVALQWNYCDILDDQHFQNLSLLRGSVQKTEAADDSPLKWEGFRQWGFLPPKPANRFVPRLLDEIRLAPEAYHLFLFRTYRQHCFPHPETGLLVSEAETPPAPALLHSLTDEGLVQKPVPYPFIWEPACRIPAPQPVVKPAEKPDRKQLATTRPPAQTHRQAPVRPPVQAVATGLSTETSVPEPATLPNPAITTAKSKPAKTESAQGTMHLSELLKRTSPPPGRVVLPVVSAPPDNAPPIFYDEDESAAPQAHGTTGILDEAGKQHKLRLAGNIADTFSLKDGSNALSASASWSPKPNWFVSGNVSMKSDGQLGYSWSAGYADWKPGTWSAQINNWGPLKPGEGLALDKAIANIGYKAKSETLEKHKLSASSNLSIPFQGKPGVSGTLQWNPKPNWYARTTANVPLTGGKPNWSYGFGYADYRPGKWRIEYSNYASNAFPGDNFRNGTITVSRGWQY
jgi:hypothetical protein